MKTTSPRLVILTVLGGILITLAVLPVALWIHAFNATNIQPERVEIFNSYFPAFLTGQNTITVISLIFCVAGIILSLLMNRLKNRILRITSILFTIIGCFTFLYYLFTLM